MRKEYFWCSACCKAMEERELQQAGSTFYCPGCHAPIRRAMLLFTPCPDCGNMMRHAPGAAFVCPCHAAPADAVLDMPAEQSVLPDEQAEAPAAMERVEDVDETPRDCREGRTIIWSPEDAQEFAYRHPDGEKLCFGDAVVLKEQQSMLFLAGGGRYWYTEAREYPLGFERRSEAEILRAAMAGYAEAGVPLLVDTHVLIFDMHKHADMALPMQQSVMLPCRMAVKLEMSCSVTLTDPAALMNHAFPSLVPEKGELMRRVADCMEAAAHQVLCARYGALTTTSALRTDLHASRAAIAQDIENLVQADDDFGLLIEDVTIVSAAAETDLCPDCAQRVRKGDAACANGHALTWCPSCASLVANGRCQQGHAVLWCPYCKAFRHAPEGVCPTHGRLGLGR